MISQDNIEIYLLDFSEGNLLPEEVAALRNYVTKFPEWRTDFEEAEYAQSEFLAKPLIKRSELHEDLSLAEEWIIAELEGVLDRKEAKTLQDLRNSSAKTQQLTQQYAPTKIPLEKVQFGHKDDLKKTAISVYLLPTFKWAAAAVILFLGINQFFVSNKGAIQNTPKVNNFTEQVKPITPLVKETKDTLIPTELAPPTKTLAVSTAITPITINDGNQDEQMMPLISKTGSLPIQRLAKKPIDRVPELNHTLAFSGPSSNKSKLKRGLRVSDLPIVGNLLAKNKVALPELKNINFSSTKNGEGKTDSWSITFFAIHIDHDKRK